VSSPIWQPTSSETRLTEFQRELEQRAGRQFGTYAALHRFSIDEPEVFWQMVWDYTGVLAERPADRVLTGQGFQDARWFPGSRLNFAENLLRYRDDQIALVGLLEDESRTTLTYAELYEQAGQLAAALKARGIEPGDRVASYLPTGASKPIWRSAPSAAARTSSPASCWAIRMRPSTGARSRPEGSAWPWRSGTMRVSQ
jgi:acetoacetyl-CoA synthetase